MKTLTRKECLDLLKEKNVPENIIKHCIVTNKVAMFIARNLVKNGEKINLKLVDCASLLHDISKHECLNNDKTHSIEAYRILSKRGYKEIAKAVKAHVVTEVNKEDFKTWEEKIVFYADKRVTHDKIVSIGDRFKYAREAYFNRIEMINNMEKLTYQIERKIFSKLSFGPEEILKLK